MLNFLFYKLGQKIAVILPLRFSYALAALVADIHRRISRDDREAVRDNLRVIFPDSNDKFVKNCTKQIFRNFAKYLIDFFRSECIDAEYVKKNVATSGLDIVDKALAKSKGVIVVSAHMANWELAGITMALLGYPIACVALTHRNRRINEFFVRQREGKGLGVIPLENAGLRCMRALKKNSLLALVGDRDFAQSGIPIDFFGKETIIPKGPAMLSLTTGAALIVGIITRTADNKFRFVYEGPIEITPSGDNEKDIKELTVKYVRVLEKYIREYPDQWLIFRRFWEPVGIGSCE